MLVTPTGRAFGVVAAAMPELAGAAALVPGAAAAAATLEVVAEGVVPGAATAAQSLASLDLCVRLHEDCKGSNLKIGLCTFVPICFFHPARDSISIDSD